ncbi:MAG: hypothetical protein IH941_14525 [Acidobacteria bacterium]|nr:hypothetical protein [Acidobacteriota bacterium]MCH8990308.1 hypothetical protein [Acidobacteriota bacterium]
MIYHPLNLLPEDTRMSSDQETRRYVARRRHEGFNTAEIMRCLKRYIARQTFKHLPETI